ncbi:MAG: hypothetical protein HRF50_07110 [Phycisphaerae bacterium]|jgi:hypothetical protein
MHDDAVVRDESHPTSLARLTAPLLGVVAPARAARRLCNVRFGTLAAIVVFQATTAACVVVGLCTWGATSQTKYVPSLAGTAVSTTTAPVSASGLLQLKFEIRRRTFGQVWADWHADGPLGAAEGIAFGVAFGYVALLALAAFLYLPWVHRAGSIGLALRRACAAFVACGGSLILALMAVGSAIVLAVHHGQSTMFAFSPAERWLAPLVAGSILALIGCLGRAMHAVRAIEPAPLFAPRCGGCGYDLSHQPADGRCPECATPVIDSLSERRRPGSPWESTGPGPAPWLVTALMVLFSPRHFYRRLRLRTPIEPALRFAGWTYATLGLGAAVWLSCMILFPSDGPYPEEVPFAVGVALTIVPLVCWFGHRVGGATVCAAWIAWRSLPDTEWAARIVAYESVFLWVFCACWGVLVSSFVLWGPWISDSVARQFFASVFRSAGEEVVLFGVTALCAALWLRRYVIAMRAVRWSNF